MAVELDLSLADKIPEPPRSLRHRREAAFGVSLVLPLLVILVLLIGYPLVRSLIYTFSDLNLADGTLSFAGLKNYAALNNELFFTSLRNTLLFVGISVGAGLAIGLGAALALSQDFPGNRVARVLLIVPWALPPVVVATMFFWILNSQYGVVNHLLLNAWRWIEQPILFLGNPKYALYTLIGIHLWKTSALMTIIFLLGLQNIPADILEAARIDGARTWTRFRRITLPQVRPLFVAASIIQFLFSIVYSFDLVLTLTSGGPGSSTYMLYFLAYKASFGWSNFGYGSVLAYMVTALMLAFSFSIVLRQKAQQAVF